MNDKKPLMSQEKHISFSIIMPTYNNSRHCMKMIRAILKFKYKQFELIIINDGSRDDTKDQLGKIKDSKLIVKNTRNHGVSAARNLGMEIAKNDYILFVDDDDIINQSILDTLDSTIKEKGYPDFVRYSGTRERKDGTIIAISGFDDEISLGSKKIVNKIIGNKCKKIDCYIWLLAIKNSKNIKPFRETLRYLEDDVFYIDNLTRKGVKIISLDNKLYAYKYNRSSKTKNVNNLKENIHDLILAGKIMLQSEHINTERQKRVISANIINLVYRKIRDAVNAFDKSTICSIESDALKQIQSAEMKPSLVVKPVAFIRYIILKTRKGIFL